MRVLEFMGGIVLAVIISIGLYRGALVIARGIAKGTAPSIPEANSNSPSTTPETLWDVMNVRNFSAMPHAGNFSTIMQNLNCIIILTRSPRTRFFIGAKKMSVMAAEMTKLEITKEECLNHARHEGDAEIGAGMVDRDELLKSSRALRDDLLLRGDLMNGRSPDGRIVVDVSLTVWNNFCAAIGDGGTEI